MLRHITMMMGVLALAGIWATDAAAAVFNVRLAPYSATGNGVTDDTTAVQNAINAAVAAGGGEVYFPAGTYKLSATLTITASVTVRGEGQRTSVLLWSGLPNFNNGIVFQSFPNPHSTLTVRGVSLLRDSGVGGVALAAIWPQLSAPNPVNYTTGGGVTALIEDIHVGSTEWPNNTKYWDYGILVQNAVAAKIATFNIQGPAGGGVTGLWVGGAASGGGTPGRTVGAMIHDGTITNYSRGAFVYDQSDMVSIRNLVIKGVITGIELVNAGNGTSVTNNQIWTTVYGIRNYNSLGDIAVTNNRIYQEVDSVFVGIEVNNESVQSTRYRIIGNYVFTPSWYTSTQTGILVANNVTDTVINGNTTHYMTSGIVLANAPVTRTLIHGNLNRNAGTTINWAAATNTMLVNNW
jgi:hypothetical protein